MSAEFFRNKKLYDREQVTVSSGSIGGTTSKIVNSSAGATTQREQPATVVADGKFRASAAYVEVISNDIYYTIDGSTPSSTNGNRLAAGQFLILTSHQKVQSFRAIRGATGTDAVIDISYYKE